jgi:hypothetical protein
LAGSSQKGRVMPIAASATVAFLVTFYLTTLGKGAAGELGWRDLAAPILNLQTAAIAFATIIVVSWSVVQSRKSHAARARSNLAARARA